MSLTVSVIGVNKVIKKLDLSKKEIQNAVFESVKETAKFVERRAKQIVPVDTGRLKSSIQISNLTKNPASAEIGTNVEYAGFVEFGTKFMAKHLYLTNASFEGEKFIKKDLKQRIKNIIE